MLKISVSPGLTPIGYNLRRNIERRRAETA
jgi:hypothetical protein